MDFDFGAKEKKKKHSHQIFEGKKQQLEFVETEIIEGLVGEEGGEGEVVEVTEGPIYRR